MNRQWKLEVFQSVNLETTSKVNGIEQQPVCPIDWSIPNDPLKEHLSPDQMWVEVLVLMSDFRPNIWCYYLSVALHWSWSYWLSIIGVVSRLWIGSVVDPEGLIKILITQDILENLKSSALLLFWEAVGVNPPTSSLSDYPEDAHVSFTLHYFSPDFLLPDQRKINAGSLMPHNVWTCQELQLMRAREMFWG